MSEGGSKAADILRTAIGMELEGKRLFEQASERMKHPRAREMFLNLVKQEVRHVQIISEQLHRMETGLGWSSLEAARSGFGYPHVSVFEDKDSVVKGLDPSAGELEVIRLGMDVESKSIDYYSKASMDVDDSNAKDIFAWLVEEEKGHLLILKAEFDSRSGSGFYYDNQEFSLEAD